MRQFAPLLLLLAFGPCQAQAARPADAAADIVKQSGFQGEVIVSRGDLRFYETIAYRDNTKPFLWRWASVTKQVVATLVMHAVAKGTIDLDTPVSVYLPAFKSPNAAKMTVRQLLRHQTGLPNPDDTATKPNAVPAFYQAAYAGNRDPLTGYCACAVKGEAVTHRPWQKLVALLSAAACG